MIALIVFILMWIPVAVDAATTYYVGKSGSDANSCATAQSSTAANRKLTMAGGIGCLAASAGDILVIGNGTYVESLDDVVPSGGGTDNTRTVIKCENARACTLDASFWAWNFVNSDTNWITIQDMVICCGNSVLVRLGTTSGVPTTNYPHHMRFQNNEIHTSPLYLIYTGHGDSNEWLNNTIHDCGEQCVYLLETNSVWRGNELYNVLNGLQFFTMHVSGGMGSANVLIEGNYLHDCITGAISKMVGIEIANTGGHTIRRNVITNCSIAGIRANVGTLTNSAIDHNVLYNNGNGILIDASGSTGNQIRNNIALSNTGQQISICSGCGVETTNLKTGVATDIFVNPSVRDMRLKSGSAAINGGTNISQSFNGSAPDQGAFETPVFSSCSVESGDTSTVRVVFENNVKPPLLPASSIAGFTSRRNAANNSVLAANRTGDNAVFLTVTTAIVGGDSVDISYAGGNLTDSSLVGNTYNQSFLDTLTNQGCANNVSGGGGATLTQTYFRFHGLRGTEGSPVVKPYAGSPVSTNISATVGARARIRIKVACTGGDCPSLGMALRYSRNGGGYTLVPDTPGADHIAFLGISGDVDVPSNGTLSTEQLTSDHATDVACALVRTANAVPTVDLAQNSETECEYVLAFDATASAGDIYDFRLYNQTGEALGAYSATPRLTIVPMAASSGM